MTTTQAQRVISRDTTSEELDSDYQWGFTIDIEEEAFPKGLNEDVVRLISAKKNEPEWMLDWRLKAFRFWSRQNLHRADVGQRQNILPIDYQDIHYYAAPKSAEDGPKSLDDVDPEVLEAFSKLGIPLEEQARLAGVAVDAVLDSVSRSHHLPGTAGKGRRNLLLHERSHPEPSRPGAEVPRLGGALRRQFLRYAELRRVLRRFLRLHPAGSALPH